MSNDAVNKVLTDLRKVKKEKATIVLLGWYGTTELAASLSVHFEVLRPPQYMPDPETKVKGQLQTMALAKLKSFSFQTELSAEMSYLTLLTLGLLR